VLGGLIVAGTIEANAAPCEKHQGTAKVACKKQLKRDRLAFPPNPTKATFVKRYGSAQWNKAMRVARCETGATLDWYINTRTGAPRGRYVGPHGMYAPLHRIARQRTGYTGRTWAEANMIALSVHDHTRGWGGWGCRGA